MRTRGNRIELYTGETLILAPDWEPVRWRASENPMMYWGGEVPQTVFVYATSPVEMPASAHSPAAPGQASQDSKRSTPILCKLHCPTKFGDDTNSGTPLWSYATEGVIFFPPAVVNGAVYIGVSSVGSDNKVYAFHLVSQEH